MIKTKIALHLCGQIRGNQSRRREMLAVFSTSFPGFSPTSKKQSDMSIPDITNSQAVLLW